MAYIVYMVYIAHMVVTWYVLYTRSYGCNMVVTWHILYTQVTWHATVPPDRCAIVTTPLSGPGQTRTITTRTILIVRTTPPQEGVTDSGVGDMTIIGAIVRVLALATPEALETDLTVDSNTPIMGMDTTSTRTVTVVMVDTLIIEQTSVSPPRNLTALDKASNDPTL